MADNIDLESIPNQIGNGIVRYDGGQVVKFSGLIQPGQLKTLYKILKDAVKCTLDDPFKKITVEFDNKSYIMTTDGELIFVVLVDSN